MIKNRTSGRTKSAFGAPAEPTASLTGSRQTVGQWRQAYKYAKTPRPLFGRRVRPYSPAGRNAREVRSGCRAEPCPSAQAAPGRGLCLTVLRMPRTDGRCGGGRPGEAPVADQGHGHAGVLGHHGGAGGRFKFAAPVLRLLAFWVERRVVPPAPHVNMTMFEDCDLAGEISHE